MLQGLRVTSLVVVASIVVAGCGGGSGNSGRVASLAPLDHVSAVRGFMDAVKLKNISTMAGFWGTRDGIAAADMDQEELVRRLTVIMTYLSHDQYEIVDGVDALMRTENRRVVTVRVSRGTCVSDVPFTVVRGGGGWLVQSMDLGLILSPRGGCQG